LQDSWINNSLSGPTKQGLRGPIEPQNAFSEIESPWTSDEFDCIDGAGFPEDSTDDISGLQWNLQKRSP
jgi:hypothetical protein